MTRPSDEALDRVAFLLWRRTLPSMPLSKQKETWTWTPAAAKRQWIELAAELAEALES